MRCEENKRELLRDEINQPVCPCIPVAEPAGNIRRDAMVRNERRGNDERHAGIRAAALRGSK